MARVGMLPRATRTSTAIVGAIFLMTQTVAPASGEPTPTPRPSSSLSCKPGQAPSLVTITTPARPGTRTPGPAATSTHERCMPAQPVPFAAPDIDPAHTIGGAGLAASGVLVRPRATVPAPPEVPAVAYLLADLDSGTILAARGAHARLRPASTLKVLTALTLMPKVAPDAQVTAKAEHLAAAGTHVGLLKDNPYRADQLFQALLMASANDAAYALTDLVGGEEAALKLMNAEAERVGAYDTVALDSSGLDVDGQMSSVYDLALFTRAAMRLPAFRQYVAQRTVSFPGGTDKATGKAQPDFSMGNINHFVWNYPGATGVKTGRTDRAKHEMVATAVRGNQHLLYVSFGSLTDDWPAAAAMMDWGFAYAGQVNPVGILVEPGTTSRPAPRAATSGPNPTSSPDAPRAPAADEAALTTGSPGSPEMASAPGSALPWIGGGCALFAGLAGVAVYRGRRPW